MNFFKMDNILTRNKNLFFLLSLIKVCALTEISKTIIFLNKTDNNSLSINWDNREAKKLYYFDGEVNTDKTYIVIKTVICETNKNYRIPSLFISKENFNLESDQVDYSSFNEQQNLMAIPTSYFNGKKHGFYALFKCNNNCGNFQLNINYTNDIYLKHGDKFSFYNDKITEPLDKLNLIIPNDYTDLKQNEKIAFILSGGFEDGLSMKVDSKEAKRNLPNVLYFEKNIDKNSLISNVSIKFKKNNQKFIFQSKMISSENKKEKVLLGEPNQYFVLNGKTCFVIEFFKNDENGNRFYDFAFESQNQTTITYYYDYNNIATKVFIQDSEEEIVSSGILSVYYENESTPICVESKGINSLIHIQLKKNKENNKMPLKLSGKVIYKTETKNKGSNSTKIDVQKMEEIKYGSSKNLSIQNNSGPFYYYINIENRKNDLPFNIIFNKLKSDSGDGEGIFDVKGYLVNNDTLHKVQTENYSLNREYKGFFDYSHHQGYIIISDNDIQKFAEENINNDIYALIKIETNEHNKRSYNYIDAKVTVFPPNDYNRTAPINVYLTYNFPVGNASRHVYKLNLNLTNSTKVKFEFSTTNKDVKYYISNSSNIFKNEFNDLKIKNISKIEDVGKDILIISQKNISEIYLIVDCPSIHNQVKYTFRYSGTEKDELEYKYNNTLGKKHTKLLIHKIKNATDDNIVDANYYIRTYKKEDFLDDLNNSITFRRGSPLEELKCGPNNSNSANDTLIFDLEKLDREKRNLLYYIEVIAEINDKSNDEYEYFGYEIFKRKSKQYFEDKDKYMFLIIIISGILLIVVIIIIAFSCFYKKRKNELDKKVEEISFKISEKKDRDFLDGTNDEADQDLLK